MNGNYIISRQASQNIQFMKINDVIWHGRELL